MNDLWINIRLTHILDDETLKTTDNLAVSPEL